MEQHTGAVAGVRVQCTQCFYFSVGAHWRESMWDELFLQWRRVARERTGVIGSSLSPQTGGTFHHGGISFQFSKPCHTSDAINKSFFFQTQGGKKMQVSSYLIISLIASRRENKLSCAVRGEKKVRSHVEKAASTTKHCYLYDDPSHPLWTIQ